MIRAAILSCITFCSAALFSISTIAASGTVLLFPRTQMAYERCWSAYWGPPNDTLPYISPLSARSPVSAVSNRPPQDVNNAAATQGHIYKELPDILSTSCWSSCSSSLPAPECAGSAPRIEFLGGSCAYRYRQFIVDFPLLSRRDKKVDCARAALM